MGACLDGWISGIFVGLRPVIPNLVSCFGPRMRVLAKVFYRGEAEVKYHASARIWGPKHETIRMTGLYLDLDTMPILSLQNSKNKCQKSSFTYDHRCQLILPFPPVHTLPTLNACTCYEGVIDWWRHNILFNCWSHGQIESSVNASCQWIIMPIMHID